MLAPELRSILLSLLICFFFSCGGTPSENEAKEVLLSVFGKLGNIEKVEKINGWTEDSNSLYIMKVKYRIKLTPEAKKELSNVSTSLLLAPLIRICSQNGKIQDFCTGKARLAFKKTENGWMFVKSKSKYIE